MVKPSWVLMRTKLRTVRESLHYFEGNCHVCAVGALVLAKHPEFNKKDYSENELEQILLKEYNIGIRMYGQILSQFDNAHSISPKNALKAVGMWLKEQGF